VRIILLASKFLIVTRPLYDTDQDWSYS